MKMHLAFKLVISVIVAISIAQPTAVAACQINPARDLKSTNYSPTATELNSLQDAADRDDPCAQVRLGRLYELGKRVAKDEGIAWSWYRKAADQSFVQAQLRLGNMYLNGHGVLQDYVLAHMWYNLAAAGRDALSVDAAMNRDFVTQKMTPKQIEEAQRLAREWKPTFVRP
jgi:TPR repeat protein